MNNLKVIGISLVTAIIVLVCGFTVLPKQVKDAPTPNAGAVSSPDIPSPYFSYGDVRHWAGQESFIVATNTLCAIQSPAATSSLTSAGARFDVQSPYTLQYELGVATTPYATTTRLALMTLAQSTNGLVIATTTNTALLDGFLAPNSYVVLKVGSSTVGANYLPTGRCTATFREL